MTSISFKSTHFGSMIAPNLCLKCTCLIYVQQYEGSNKIIVHIKLIRNCTCYQNCLTGIYYNI